MPQAAIVGASILAIALALAASRARSLPAAAAALAGLSFILGIVAAVLGVSDLILPLAILIPAVAIAMFWRGAVLTRLREKVPFRSPLLALVLAALVATLLAGALIELPSIAAADASRRHLTDTAERLIDRGEAVLGGAAPSRSGRTISFAASIGLLIAAAALAWFHVDGTGGGLAAGLAGGLALTALATALRRRWGGSWSARALALLALLAALGIVALPVTANGEFFDFAVFGRDFADGQRIGIRVLTAALAVALAGFLAGHLVTIEEKPHG